MFNHYPKPQSSSTEHPFTLGLVTFVRSYFLDGGDLQCGLIKSILTLL